MTILLDKEVLEVKEEAVEKEAEEEMAEVATDWILKINRLIGVQVKAEEMGQTEKVDAMEQMEAMEHGAHIQ